MEKNWLQLVLRSKSNQKCKYDSPVYAGEFFDYNDSWRHAINQEKLNQSFRLIAKEWVVGEN